MLDEFGTRYAGRADVVAGERRVHHFAHLHHWGQRRLVGTGADPKLGAGRRWQHRLHVDTLWPHFERQPLRQE
jgi:hypothetical protein